MKRYLAIDIGASSGRHIVGWTEDGELKAEEVYRFPNGVSELAGHLTWDLDALTEHGKTGIEKARARFGPIESLSIDTWSLLGVKTEKPITDAASELANWSNEGGVGYNRYQKNIMGMWLVNRLRDELCPDKPFSEIVAEAEKSRFEETVDANGQCFLAPLSMKAAFDAALSMKPQSYRQLKLRRAGGRCNCHSRRRNLCYCRR